MSYEKLLNKCAFVEDGIFVTCTFIGALLVFVVETGVFA